MNRTASLVCLLRQYARWSLLLGVALTPIFAFADVAALLRGIVPTVVTGLTPAGIKAVKDILIVLTAVTALLAMLLSGRVNRLFIPFVLLAGYGVTSALWSFGVDPFTAAAGLRWLLPFLLVFLLIDVADAKLLTRLTSITAVLLVPHVAVQLAQSLYMMHLYGTTFFGFAGRTPGLFFIPNTAGFFAVVAFYLAYFFPSGIRLRRLVFLLAPLSIFLTQSGTAFIVLVVLAALILAGRRRVALFIPAGLVAGAVVFSALGALTGRGGAIDVSGGTRAAIFLRTLTTGELLPQQFGYATNAAVNLAFGGFSAVGQQVTVATLDSTYANLIGNLGLVGFAFVVVFLLTWLLSVVRAPRPDVIGATLVTGLYAATTSVSEAFPMNVILSAVFAHFFRVHYLPFWIAFTRPPGARGGEPAAVT